MCLNVIYILWFVGTGLLVRSQRLPYNVELSDTANSGIVISTLENIQYMNTSYFTIFYRSAILYYFLTKFTIYLLFLCLLLCIHSWLESQILSCILHF